MEFNEPLTWKQVHKILKEWMEYGDDPFYDQYAEYLDELKTTTDPKRAAVLKDILKLMDFLKQFID